LIAIPVVLIFISIIQVLTVEKIAVLILVLLTAYYCMVPLRKKNCTTCKMRLFCKGCAVK